MTAQSDQDPQTAANSDDFDDALDGLDEWAKHSGSVSEPPQDRAELAAGSLLRQLVRDQNVKIGKNDLVVIEVFTSEWVDPTAEAAPVVLLARQPADRQNSMGRVRGNDGLVHVYKCTEPQDDKPFDRLATEVAADFLAGKAVIIVTHDANAMIPGTILKTADHRLVLPPMDAAWFTTFLGEATGNDVADALSDMRFEDLKPEMLRLAMRRGQTAGDYAQRLARLTRAERKKPVRTLTLDDLHGMPAVVTWAKSLAVDLNEYRAGRLAWDDCDPGALLCGPPGTGKTAVARAIANYCGIPFFPTSYSEWQAQGRGHLGDVTKAIRSVFQQACKKTPALLFIDELDSVSSRDQSSNYPEWWRSIINTLLELLDGATGREGLIVIGATNFPENIDPAIRRAGRLDREFEIGPPDVAALAGIYRYHLGDVVQPADLSRIAALSHGKTGADVVKWARGARRRARLERRAVVFDDVFQEIVGAVPDADEPFLRRVAVHEAGHAVVFTLQYPDSPTTVSMGANGFGARAMLMAPKNQSALTEAGINDMLIMFLAGRAAEEVICGKPSAGAGGSPDSDLAKATRLAMAAEVSFGLGSSGLIWRYLSTLDSFERVLANRGGTESAVRKRLDDAYTETKKLITENRSTVERLAAVLLARVVLVPEEVRKIIQPNNGSGHEKSRARGNGSTGHATS